MRIATLAAVVNVAVVGLALAAPAQALIKKDTNIAHQQLGSALRELAKEHRFQVFFKSDLVSRLTTDGITGLMTTDEAMQRLLLGTGLTYKYLDDHTVVVDKERLQRDTEAGQGATHTPNNSPSAPSGAESTASPVPPAQSNSKSDLIEEVLVTAQKRQERLIDTPQSVSVLSADALAKLGATQFRDYANTIPGLSFQTAGPGYTQISLRGVSIGQDIAPTVAIYVDEVPYGSTTTFARGGQITLDAGLFDVDQIEVLRGPQGTLYGASTVGGLIKYVTKRPDTAAFGGEVQAGLSGTEHGSENYNVAGAVNLPLIKDKLAMRASGFETHDGGYIDNLALGRKDVNASDIYGGRLDLLFTPIDALSVRVNGFIQDTLTDGFPLADFTRTGQPIDNSLAQRRLFPESFDQRYRLLSGTVSYDLGWSALTSASSYQEAKTGVFVDYTPVVLPTLPAGIVAGAVGYTDDSSTDKFTQEVRLASRSTHTIEWVFGGFYTHERSRLGAAYVLRDPAGQPLPNTVYTFFAPSTYEEYAAFGDLTWHLNEKIDVTGGARYADNRQQFEQFGSGTYGRSAPPTRSTGSVTTYLADARYHFNDHATGYLRYATGYRPGGPNVLVIDPTTGQRLGPPTFQPDRLKSYEAGFKTETEDRRFGADLAVYYIDWSNIQINVVRRGFGTKDNAPGGATVKGVELSLVAQPVSSLKMSGAFAYQDATMDQALPTVGAAKGERLPAVPRLTGSVNGDYQFSESGLQPSIGATVRYVGDSRNNFGPDAYTLPSYTMVDLHAGFMLNRVTLQLYAHNLFDERAELTPRFRYFPAAGPIQVAILQPRTIGVLATMKF